MGFFGRRKSKQIENTNANATNNRVAPTSNPTAEELIIRMFQEKRETDALKLSAVYSAISIRSNTMSKIPFSIINRHTKEHLDDKNLYTLLNVRPNSNMNASVFKLSLSNWQLYNGNAYAIPIRKRFHTEVQELLLANPAEVDIVKSSDGKIFYDVDIKKKFKGRLRNDEIIHFMAFTFDGIDGVSPLTYARNTIQTGLNQEVFAEDFYANYCRPADYLKTKADLSGIEKVFDEVQPDGTIKKVKKSAKEVMRNEWDKLQMNGNRFKTAILDNGLEYGTVPQISMEDMQFVSSKTVNVEDIARFYSMASCAFKLGIGKQTYSNNEQGQICYITDTIVPTLNQWEQELTLKLLTEKQLEEGWVIKGNVNVELRGDMMTQANFYEKMLTNGIYNINECRELEDRPSIGELGDKRYIGPNRVPLEKLDEGESAGSVTPNPMKENNNE